MKPYIFQIVVTSTIVFMWNLWNSLIVRLFIITFLSFFSTAREAEKEKIYHCIHNFMSHCTCHLWLLCYADRITYFNTSTPGHLSVNELKYTLWCITTQCIVHVLCNTLYITHNQVAILFFLFLFFGGSYTSYKRKDGCKIQPALGRKIFKSPLIMLSISRGRTEVGENNIITASVILETANSQISGERRSSFWRSFQFLRRAPHIA